jgi:hypothetical protein
MDAGIDSATDSDEARWLTYNELAEIRRIDRHSAVKLVMRHGWRRQKDNRGALRILVPSEWALSKDKGTDRKGPDSNLVPGIGTDTGTDISRAIIALETAVTSITARAEIAEKRAEAAESRVNQAETRADQAERALVEAQGRANQAETAQNRLENELEAAKIALGEAEADAAELSTAVQKAEHDRAAAVAIADEAVRAAEELRQADAERKARGRWAWLKAAWQGR